MTGGDAGRLSCDLTWINDHWILREASSRVPSVACERVEDASSADHANQYQLKNVVIISMMQWDQSYVDDHPVGKTLCDIPMLRSGIIYVTI